MKKIILIILVFLIALGAGGFFVYKNIFVPEVKVPKTAKEEAPVTEEKIEEEGAPEEKEAAKEKLNYEERGIEGILESELQELCKKYRESWPPECAFVPELEGRKLCEKCKELRPAEKTKEEAVAYQRLDLSFFKGVWTVTGGAERALNQDIQKMKADGVNIFPIAPLFNVDPSGSIELTQIREWAGREEEGYLRQIRRAHEAGLAVFLELDPIYVESPKDFQWLEIPESIKPRFMENFVDVVLHWAEIAETEGVELFSPINEPNSEILLGDKYAIEFLERILPQVKEKFTGELVAKFADMGPQNISQYGTLKGYDYIAVDIYAIDVPEETFMEHFDSVVNQSLANVAEFNLKGFIFGELGVEPADEGFQSDLFQRIFEESWDKTRGYFICGWGPNIDPTDPLTVEFTDKPAEDVLKEWYTKE